MRKVFIFLVSTVLFAACGSSDKPSEPTPQPAAPMAKDKNSDAFNQSFDRVLTNYIHLKDNFITEGLAMIDFYAIETSKAIDSLKYNEIKGEAGIAENTKSFAESMKAELKGLVGEKDLVKKRKSFNMLTDQFYNLIRIVQYNQKVIYHFHYAEAFTDGDPNAFWLSTSKDVKNPYNSAKLLEGEIADSLDYSKQ